MKKSCNKGNLCIVGLPCMLSLESPLHMILIRIESYWICVNLFSSINNF